MANVDAPRGFKLVGHLSGQVDAPQVITCLIPAADAGNYFVGDVVRTATATASADATTGLRIVERAAAGALFLGVIVDVLPLEDAPNVSITKTYRAASTRQKVKVCVDPGAIYEVQTDGAALTVTKGIGLNADVAIGTGSTVTGNSGDQLADSTLAVTASLQWHVHGIVDAPDNVIGANVRVLVVINDSEMKEGQLSTALAT